MSFSVQDTELLRRIAQALENIADLLLASKK